MYISKWQRSKFMSPMQAYIPKQRSNTNQAQPKRSPAMDQYGSWYCKYIQLYQHRKGYRSSSYLMSTRFIPCTWSWHLTVAFALLVSLLISDCSSGCHCCPWFFLILCTLHTIASVLALTLATTLVFGFRNCFTHSDQSMFYAVLVFGFCPCEMKWDLQQNSWKTDTEHFADLNVQKSPQTSHICMTCQADSLQALEPGRINDA